MSSLRGRREFPSKPWLIAIFIALFLVLALLVLGFRISQLDPEKIETSLSNSDWIETRGVRIEIFQIWTFSENLSFENDETWIGYFNSDCISAARMDRIKPENISEIRGGVYVALDVEGERRCVEVINGSASEVPDFSLGSLYIQQVHWAPVTEDSRALVSIEHDLGIWMSLQEVMPEIILVFAGAILGALIPNRSTPTRTDQATS